MGWLTKADFFQAHAGAWHDPAPKSYEQVEALYLGRLAMLAVILERLRRNPLAPLMVVFGSAGRGEVVPGDLDVFVDLRPGQPALRAISRDERAAARADLLAIGAYGTPFYGLLDPFLLVHPKGQWQRPVLWCRNDDSRGWIRAKGRATSWPASSGTGVRCPTSCWRRTRSQCRGNRKPGHWPASGMTWKRRGATTVAATLGAASCEACTRAILLYKTRPRGSRKPCWNHTIPGPGRHDQPAFHSDG